MSLCFDIIATTSPSSDISSLLALLQGIFCVGLLLSAVLYLRMTLRRLEGMKVARIIVSRNEALAELARLRSLSACNGGL